MLGIEVAIRTHPIPINAIIANKVIAKVDVFPFFEPMVQ